MPQRAKPGRASDGRIRLNYSTLLPYNKLLPCIMLIKEVARTLCKAKGSPKVSVRTFFEQASPSAVPLCALPCALLSGWPRGLGPLNSSSHSLISTSVSVQVSVVSSPRSYLWFTSATVRIPVHTTICTLHFPLQLMNESHRNQGYVWTRENKLSHSLLVWTEALSSMVWEGP